MGEDRQDATGPPSAERVSVPQAADHLGTTVDALRKRVQRGTIPHERDRDGRVWILLDTARPRQDTDQDTGRPQSDPVALISEMRGRIEDLREQLEAERQAHSEARRIIAGLVERIPPAIEAPEETSPPAPDHDRSTHGGERTETDGESGRGRSMARILLTYVLGVLLVCGAGATDSVMYEDPAFGPLMRTVPLALLAAWVFGAYAGYVDGRAPWFSKWFPYVAVITAIAATAAISYGSVLVNQPTFAQWIETRNLFAKGIALVGTGFMCHFGALASKTALLPWTSDQGQIEKKKTLLVFAGSIVVPAVTALLSMLQKASGP